ncbi:MAG: hypothetical protein IJO80_06420 [Firmicutes bacterium]|nr:hypothetical protein [Bacillota bacterium]
MKKLLIVLMMLMLLFSFAACGGEEEPTPPVNDNPPVGQQEQPGGEDKQEEKQDQQIDQNLLSTYLNTKTGKFYSQFANGKMYMEYKTSLEGMEMTVISASNGSKTYSETLIGGISSGASIIEGDVMYTLMPEMKMAYKMALGNTPANIATEVISEDDVEMADLKKGTRTVNGKTYDTEEWVVDGVASIMCFDGNELKYIIGEAEGMEVVMEIVTATNKVDDSLFVIPADYTVMDIQF